MLVSLILMAVAVLITAYFLPGVTVDPWWVSIIVAVVLGLINTVVRPVVKLLSLPINLLTLGLFSFVINALMVLLCAWIVPSFHVDGFISALLFSIILSVVNWVLNVFFGK